MEPSRSEIIQCRGSERQTLAEGQVDQIQPPEKHLDLVQEVHCPKSHGISS